MSFSEKVQAEALVACGRCCCICHKFCGTKIALHHIKQKAYGGDDSFENCIPLCLDCHEDMGKADPKHVTGKHYTERELIMHRNNWYKEKGYFIQSQVNSHPSVMRIDPNMIFAGDVPPEQSGLPHKKGQVYLQRLNVSEHRKWGSNQDENVPDADIDTLFRDVSHVLVEGNTKGNQNVYLSADNTGKFTFDYSNNDGKYIIGTGEYEFVTRWSKASDRSIHAYKDSLGENGAVARVKVPDKWPATLDDGIDFSSRVRTPEIGDVIIWRNSYGKYAATRIVGIKDDTRGADHDELTCEYTIYRDTVQNDTVCEELQNSADGHTVIVDDEKYIAERIVEEHNREIERLLAEI